MFLFSLFVLKPVLRIKHQMKQSTQKRKANETINTEKKSKRTIQESNTT